MSNFNCNAFIDQAKTQGRLCKSIDYYCEKNHNSQRHHCTNQALQCAANKQCEVSTGHKTAPCQVKLSEHQINRSGIKCTHWLPQAPKTQNPETGEYRTPPKQCLVTIDKNFMRNQCPGTK